MKDNYLFILWLLLPFFLACENKEEVSIGYENQIGDTHYVAGLDTEEFEFCDSTNVLHKRAYVGYHGGTQALLEELNGFYDDRFIPTNFEGFFIVRLGVNCNGQPGRFRIESLDTQFNPLEENKEWEDYILSLSRRLKNWKKPYYRGQFYDGYTFFILKFNNGKMENYEM
ncbi:MAG: hypothetical protein KTR22_13080 [Flavobacteriaceae bacterium]|nr:hypothetical protein [Flavobacteriaceae bacterium]